MELKKSKKATIENRRGSGLLMGFVVALAFMFVSFEWTQHDSSASSGLLAGHDPIIEENLIPITFREEKPIPPPPPPAPAASEVLQIIDNSSQATGTVTVPTEGDRLVLIIDPPAGVIEPEVGEDGIFVFAEEMPQFPGGTAALMRYLAANIRYPERSLEIGSQGKVIVQFVVDKNGAITDPVVLKSVDPYLDKEAVRVISSMPKWNPGKQRNVPVRVKYTVPVTFRLQ